jgi:hypothetical protein
MDCPVGIISDCAKLDLLIGTADGFVAEGAVWKALSR